MRALKIASASKFQMLNWLAARPRAVFVDAAEYELVETVRQVEARLGVAKNSQPM